MNSLKCKHNIQRLGNVLCYIIHYCVDMVMFLGKPLKVQCHSKVVIPLVKALLETLVLSLGDTGLILPPGGSSI